MAEDAPQEHATSDIGYRRVRENDLPMLRNWRNSAHVARFMYTDHPISEEEHRAWFARIREEPRLSYWLIELDGAPVGLASAAEINFERKTAGWAFYLADPKTRGRHVGVFTEYCVLECAFDYWRLDTLQCEVLATNLAVSSIHESVGFTMAGRLTGKATKGGSPVDAIIYAMTKRDWLSEHRARLEARIRAKGREPLPLLSALERREVNTERPFDDIDARVTQVRIQQLMGQRRRG